MRDNPGAGQCRNPFRGAEFEACPSEHQRTAHGGARAWRPSGECDGNLPQHVRWLAGLQTRPKSRFSSLKESHGDEKQYYNEKVGKLQREYQKLQDRIDAMYVDKPDGRVSQEFFDRKNSDWRADRLKFFTRSKNIKMQTALTWKRAFGFFELAQQAATLYEKQEMKEKRRILDFLFSNCLWKDGDLIPNFRKPFDILALTNSAYQTRKAASRVKSGLSETWLPRI